MPFNGSGTFQRVRNWVNDAASGIKIRADYHDAEDDNIAAGLSNVITKDGQTTILQNIPFNGKRITGLGDPTAAQDAVTKNWLSTLGEFNLLKFLTPDMSIIGRVAGTPPGSPNRIAFNDKPDGTGTDVLVVTETGVMTAQTRNRVVNGGMQISQENGNAVGSTNTYYPADQWMAVFGTTGALFIQRVQVVTPNGSKDRFRIAVNTADSSLAAGELLVMQQSIEGSRMADFRYGLASAKQSILRFGFKAPAGTYSIALNNAAANRSYVANFTIAAGQANADTEQIFVIPGDITGTWPTDTSVALALRVTIATGSATVGAAGWQAGNFLGTSSNTNGLATAGNTFELFDVGWYLDPQATGAAPPWQMPDEAEEAQTCMRYYYKVSGGVSGTLINAGAIASGAGVAGYGSWLFPVRMRISPTLTFTNVATANVSGTMSAQSVSPDGFRTAINSAAAGTFYYVFDPIANARM